VLFFWQFPHFMTIAWMYREDYERAGYLVPPKGNARVPFVIVETLFPRIEIEGWQHATMPAHSWN
jgi:heme o synthase